MRISQLQTKNPNSSGGKEVYEAELDKMNSAIASENQTLQYDNKQLNTLIKEYEQTLDTLMSMQRHLKLAYILKYL